MNREEALMQVLVELYSLRFTDVIRRSRTTKQPKTSAGSMKTLRKKLREAISKFIIYKHLPINLSNSPWLHNFIVAVAKASRGVKCPTPYEISYVYLEAEYKNMHEWKLS